MDPSLPIHRCSHCQRTFPGKKRLNKHVESVHTSNFAPSQTPSKVRRCCHCQQSFPLRKSLREHVKNNHIYRCSHCQRTFPRRKSLNKHVKSVHTSNFAPAQTPSKVPRCSRCQRTFPSSKSLKKHVRSFHVGIMQTNASNLAAYRPQCAVCDMLVPGHGWIGHITDSRHQKKQRQSDVALKRRMTGRSRGIIQVDRLALNFGHDAPGRTGAATQTWKVTNVGRTAVYFSPWVRDKFFALKGGSEKRRLEPGASALIEVKVIPKTLRGHFQTRLDITFQLPDQNGRATITRPISA
ncbi:hypothetical protein C8R44DRAFT_856037 [Mycena epipterygia]|nr:hypothetical protein C8R44DRAFT_856037 [Mycena epipterygia]